jgi:hypothetical protein
MPLRVAEVSRHHQYDRLERNLGPDQGMTPLREIWRTGG